MFPYACWLCFAVVTRNGIYVGRLSNVWYPSDLSGISVESETFEFRNITSGMVTSFTTRKGITLPEGLYDCSYEAAITYQTADSTIHTSLSGYARSLELMGAQGSVSIGSYQVENKDDFIIRKYFLPGHCSLLENNTMEMVM